MKKIGFALLMMLSSIFIFGNESISVGILNGPSSIPTGYMMENVTEIDNADLTFLPSRLTLSRTTTSRSV